MPTPHEGESRDDFISRCIPIVLADEAADDQDQAVAICNSMWEEASKEQDKMTDTMEHKTFSSFVTKADEDQGIIEAVFAVFGNIDQGNDIIHPGAFTKTFAERGGKVRVLDNHRTDTVMRAIGKPLMFKEVSREELPPQLLAQHPEATGGAFASVQMLMDTPEGKGAFIRLKEGAIDEWSFGYDPLDVDFSQAIHDGKEVNVRNLRTLKLFEISPVLFAMNEATTTVSAKAEEIPYISHPAKYNTEDNIESIYTDADTLMGFPIVWKDGELSVDGDIVLGDWSCWVNKKDKTVSGATNLPIADRGRAWDATAAIGRVRSFTGSTEEPSSSYKSAFFWFDGDEPDSFGSYKLPFADVIGGKLTAIPRGVFAGAQRLDATDISVSDKEGVRSRMTTYYGRMRRQFDDDGIVAPWNKALEFGDGRYMITSELPMTDVQVHRMKEKLKAWWADKEEKFFVIGFPVTIAEVREAPVTPQVATDNQNDKQAGPEPQVGEAPPTSSVLDEIALLELEIELLEASYV